MCRITWALGLAPWVHLGRDSSRCIHSELLAEADTDVILCALTFAEMWLPCDSCTRPHLFAKPEPEMKGLLALHRAVLGVSTTSKPAHRSIACSALCASGSVRHNRALCVRHVCLQCRFKLAVLIVQALSSDRPLRIGFIGAGGINFGSQGVRRR